MSTKNLRRLTKLLPKLIQASMIRPALALEKVIASTFELSPEISKMLGGVPYNHREEFVKQYRNHMFSAYECGQKCAAKMPELVLIKEPNALKEFCSKLQIPFQTSNDLSFSLEESVKEFMKTVPTFEGILVQFKLDLEMAYRLGVLDFATNFEQHQEEHGLIPEVVTVPEVSKASSIMPNEPNEKDEDMDEEFLTVAGFQPEQDKKDTMSALERYVKLLGPENEAVLRATLGMQKAAPGPTVAASVAKGCDGCGCEEGDTCEGCESGEGCEIGPFNVDQIKSKLETLLQSADIDPEKSEQAIVIECLVPDFKELSDEAACEAICSKLGIDCAEYQGIKDVMMAADAMAEEITEAIQMPGCFLFMDTDDKFCLVYMFETVDAVDNAKAVKQIIPVTSSATAALKKGNNKSTLPIGPQGTLTVKEQEEIKALHCMGSLRGKSMKELKAASVKACDYMKSCFNEAMTSGCTIGSGLTVLLSQWLTWLLKYTAPMAISFMTISRKNLRQNAKAQKPV